MLFLLMHLQGIEKLIPETYTYGLDEPPSVMYKLTESQFEEIINDDLFFSTISLKKLKY